MKENIKSNINKITDNKSLLNFVLIATIFVLIIFNWQSCEKNKELKANYSQNVEAMKKEITVEKNKNGELQSSIVAFQGSINDVKGYSEELYNEIKALKNRKPTMISRTEIIYKDTNIVINNNVIDTIGLDKDEYRLRWFYANSDSSRIIEGNSLFSARFLNEKLNVSPILTTITRDELKLEFIVGVARNKKTKYNEIFVTPKNPNITVSKLEGAILDKRKLGIDISVSGGYGAVYTKGQLGFGPFIGIGISKSIIRF
jgi:hypothetical protein